MTIITRCLHVDAAESVLQLLRRMTTWRWLVLFLAMTGLPTLPMICLQKSPVHLLLIVVRSSVLCQYNLHMQTDCCIHVVISSIYQWTFLFYDFTIFSMVPFEKVCDSSLLNGINWLSGPPVGSTAYWSVASCCCCQWLKNYHFNWRYCCELPIINFRLFCLLLLSIISWDKYFSLELYFVVEGSSVDNAQYS